MIFKRENYKMILWLLLLLFHVDHAMFRIRYCCNKNKEVILVKEKSTPKKEFTPSFDFTTKGYLNNSTVKSHLMNVILEYLTNDIDSVFKLFTMNQKCVNDIYLFYKGKCDQISTSLVPISSYGQSPYRFIPYELMQNFEHTLAEYHINLGYMHPLNTPQLNFVYTLMMHDEPFTNLYLWSNNRTQKILFNKLNTQMSLPIKLYVNDQKVIYKTQHPVGLFNIESEVEYNLKTNEFRQVASIGLSVSKTSCDLHDIPFLFLISFGDIHELICTLDPTFAYQCAFFIDGYDGDRYLRLKGSNFHFRWYYETKNKYAIEFDGNHGILHMADGKNFEVKPFLYLNSNILY